MSLDEKRLLILATPLARTTTISGKDKIFISAEEFALACGVDRSTAYTALETASDRIFQRFFSYISDDNKRVKVRWTYKTEYGDGGADIYFTDDVLLMLRTFDELNPYTKYKKEVVLKLKLDYSLDLYHLAKKYQKITEFSMTLDDLFEQFDLPESYRDLSNLKRVFKANNKRNYRSD
jgi:plasmid replication initiation protein